ncbi:MAG TPA: hypothetical protein VH678_15000 [Xanthobacteraceae bacterium]|jgi:hypothetical protein
MADDAKIKLKNDGGRWYIVNVNWSRIFLMAQCSFTAGSNSGLPYTYNAWATKGRFRQIDGHPFVVADHTEFSALLNEHPEFDGYRTNWIKQPQKGDPVPDPGQRYLAGISTIDVNDKPGGNDLWHNFYAFSLPRHHELMWVPDQGYYYTGFNEATFFDVTRILGKNKDAKQNTFTFEYTYVNCWPNYEGVPIRFKFTTFRLPGKKKSLAITEATAPDASTLYYTIDGGGSVTFQYRERLLPAKSIIDTKIYIAHDKSFGEFTGPNQQVTVQINRNGKIGALSFSQP